jgi:hypothetical protein
VGYQIRYLRLRLAPPARGVNAGSWGFGEKPGKTQDYLTKIVLKMRFPWTFAIRLADFIRDFYWGRPVFFGFSGRPDGEK